MSTHNTDNNPTVPKKKHPWRSYILGWILGPLVGVIFFPTVFLVFFCMLPTIIAYIIDKYPEKYGARTVGYVNIGATFGLGWKLWNGDNSFQGAVNLLAEPLGVVLIYLSALLGWLVYFAVPYVISIYTIVSLELQMRSAKSRRRDLVKEWGPSLGKEAELIYQDKLDADINDVTMQETEPPQKGLMAKLFFHMNIGRRIQQRAYEETSTIVQQQHEEFDQFKVQQEKKIKHEHEQKAKRSASRSSNVSSANK